MCGDSSQFEKTQRAGSGRSYRGIEIHAAPGIHEFALAVVTSKVPAGARVLDMGSGSGAFAMRLLDTGFDVISNDIDTSAIPADIPSYEGDIRQIDESKIPSCSLDCVVALEVLEHVDDPCAVLEAMHDKLKPGGIALVSTPNVLHPYSRLKFLMKGTLYGFDSSSYWKSGHTTPLPSWLLMEHFKAAGFSSLLLGYAGEIPATLLRGVVLRALSGLYRPPNAVLGTRDDASALFVCARRNSA